MRLTDNIHILQIDFEIIMSPEKKLQRFVNVIIIFGDRITLIDTGIKGSETYIYDYIKKQNRDFSDIETIILSHSHPDHIGSAAIIKEMTHCRVYSEKSEKEWIENIELQNKIRPVPGFFNLVDKPVTIDEFLNDGQDFRVDDKTTLKIIKSSGHSVGSLNILFKEAQVLFTADSIPLKNDIPNYYSYNELIKSLEKIKNNREYNILLTSWTLPLTDEKSISEIITNGEEYLRQIDIAVKECYKSDDNIPLNACKKTIEKLKLPSAFINPIVDIAFRSHL
jgi:hydroxyacylglutathione hydrolase